jgi:glyoxylase-like metal-dependent hydrolase (beta-lactamase superfamily II)
MARLIAISGLGAKGPACFILETGRARLMLDLGYGPQPGLWPDVSEAGRVDALLLSHGHRDHAGGLKLASQVGDPPVFATPAVLSRLGLAGTALPLRGEAVVCGTRIRTGRDGHAPGGIWMHFEIGDGVLYTGDYSVESPVYEYDEPPKAGTLLMDASYGDYSASLADCAKGLAPYFERAGTLLPVPADGRGPELAFHLATSRRTLPRIGPDVRASLERLAGPERDSLRDGVAGELARIAREAPSIDGPRGVLLAGPANAGEGETARLLSQWQRLTEPAIVFTGYFPPDSPAARLVDSGRAHYVRWSVHPRLFDNQELIRSTRAKVVMPAFGDARHLEAWRAAFAPARVTLDREVRL